MPKIFWFSKSYDIYLQGEGVNINPLKNTFDGDCSTLLLSTLVNIKSIIPDVIIIGEPLLPTLPPELLLAAALAADSWIGEDVPLLMVTVAPSFTVFPCKYK